MLIIRLQRVGKKNEPTFRVVLTDSKNGPKSGKFLEVLGSYDPRDKNITKINGDRVKELISTGAQVSDTVHNILINLGITEGEKINVLPKKSPIIDEEALAKEKEEAEAKAAAEAEKEVASEETPAEAEEPAPEATEAVKDETPVVEESTPETETEKTEEAQEEKVDADPVEKVEEAVAEEEKKEEASTEEEK